MTQRTVFNDPRTHDLLKFPSRRSILKRAMAMPLAAPLAAGPVMALPRHATAFSGIMATQFPGSGTFIANDGTIQGFPVGGAYDLWISYWYNSSVQAPLNHCILSHNTSISNGHPAIQINHLSGTKRGTAYLQVAIGDTTTSHGLQGKSSPGSLPYGVSGYNQVMIQANTQTGLLKAYLRNAPISSFSIISSAVPFLIPFNQNPNGTPMKWAVGSYADNNHGAYFNGALAEAYLIAGTPVDITNAMVRNTFIDPTTFLPRRAGDYPAVMDTSGGTINVLQTFTPQIHLWGGPDQFLLNEPNWTNPAWSWTSPPNIRTDNGPNQFYVPMGALTLPSSDPWGFTGEV